MTTLTIELDDELAAQAKRLAVARETSVEAVLIESLREVTARGTGRRSHHELAPLTRSVFGIATLPPGKSPDDVRFDWGNRP